MKCKNCNADLSKKNTSGYCSPCRVKKWHAEHRERSNEIKRKHIENHPDSKYQSIKKYRENNRQRVNSWAVLNYHVANGDIEKPTQCESCNQARMLHAHHSDVTKPLSIKWVCASCHKIEHGYQIGVRYA